MAEGVAEETRECIKCHVVKPLSSFHRNKQCSKGRLHTCRDCVSDYSAKHSEKLKDRSRKWVEDNPERHREKRRLWGERNRVKTRKQSTDYYYANAERLCQAQRDWLLKNPHAYEAHMIAQEIPLAAECELCPEDDKRTVDLQRHHPDYAYPEIFVTACRSCHKFAEQSQVELPV